MTTSNTAVQVMAALAYAGGRYIDGHNNKSTVVKYAAIFKRPDMEDMVVPLLTNTYFSLSAIEINEEGVLRMSPWSVGGLVDSRGLTMEQTVAAFNEAYKTSELVELTEFEAKPEVPVKPAFEMPQDFYTWVETEHHDAEGTIFYRNRFNSTITGKDTVAWEIARTTALMPNNVFVREYTEAGKISHYIRMPVMEKLIQHHDFCKTNGYPCVEIRNLEVIRGAIAEFYQIRGIIC